MDLRDRLSLEHLILQAGFAGGLAGADLAAAVSGAGALGTVGLVGARALRAEIRRARELAPGRPVAVNLLMPFVRRAHVDVCVEERVTAAVLFFGHSRSFVSRLREAGVFVLHQVGTPAEARRALRDGADALIAQGLEAGGHLLGVQPALAALARVREVADEAPVFAAGGIADSAAVRAALSAGASGVLCGSRFLLTHESRAIPGYKARVLGAERTVVTTLFGFGWPARHRVVPNAATERWGSGGVLTRMSGFAGRLLPMSAGARLSRMQRLSVPLYSPMVPTEERLLDVSPLYAGECVREIRDVLPAAQVVRELVG
ncbi:MAG TPA: nitronate monooxygenase [Polyangiaceae bacterium]